MQKHIFTVFALALLFCFASPARATDPGSGALSAGDLHGLCTSSSDIDYGYCAGYVSAVAHVLLDQPVGGVRACHHANVRSQQLIDTFNSWTELFPERMGDDAATAVAAAFARAFPCAQ